MSNRSTEILDSNHSCYRELRGISNAMDRLGHAFLMVGNKQVGSELQGMASDICEIEDTLSGNNSETLSINLRNATEATNNMLNGILAVSEATT